jgi:hypothetical protein
MRVVLAVASLSALLALPSVAAAQSPPNTLLVGTIRNDVTCNASRACSVTSGPSHFKRNGNSYARIAVPELIYASYDTTAGTTNGPRNAYVVSGEARMSFTTATSGRLIFDFNTDYPLDIRQPTFSEYSQTYDSAAQQLQVVFTVRIRNCSVRMRGIYRP